LGSGGYAEVFLYEQDNTHLRVAVKVLFKESLTERSRERFAAEAMAMAELADHPYIVQVFQADVTADERPYLVMKYYPQRNLALRAKDEQLSVPEVLQIGVRISCAVETAHRAGILHRDIKPANILTSQYGEPGLTDFGIATRNSGDAEEESQGLSIPWSAPEVVFATSAGDHTADVYSLGASLWHLLAGRTPFEVPGGDNSTPALMRRIREQPVRRTGRDDVPTSLERLLAQAMAKNPLGRPQTALQLARALQGIEVEQHWVPTPLVMLDETLDAHDDVGETSTPTAENEGDEPPTRRRQPQAVVAQHERTPADTGPGSDDSDSPTVGKIVVPNDVLVAAVATALPTKDGHGRVRQGIPSVADESATVRRPKVASPEAGPEDLERPVQPDSADRSRSKTWKLAIASFALVIAGLGAAFALSHQGDAKPGSPTTTPTGSAPTLVVPSPVGPVVTGRRLDADRVQFSWTMANAEPNDQFFFKEPGGKPQEVKGNTVTLPAPAQVCIEVEVDRVVRGSPVSADSDLTCAG